MDELQCLCENIRRTIQAFVEVNNALDYAYLMTLFYVFSASEHFLRMITGQC